MNEENIIRVAVIDGGEEVLRDFVAGRSDMTVGSYKDELVWFFLFQFRIWVVQ